MAGSKVILGKDSMGFPVMTIVENGNVQEDDEWGLFRLTDEGLCWYNEGAEFRAGIMGMEIDGRRMVEELSPRYKTREEITMAWDNLSSEEKGRTLIRSVRPRK
jgi:hypothetical protein